MEVILLERVEKLGAIGDVVNVKPGFARNYLLPNKKALRANEANRKLFEATRAQIEKLAPHGASRVAEARSRHTAAEALDAPAPTTPRRPTAQRSRALSVRPVRRRRAAPRPAGTSLWRAAFSPRSPVRPRPPRRQSPRRNASTPLRAGRSSRRPCPCSAESSPVASAGHVVPRPEPRVPRARTPPDTRPIVGVLARARG